MQAPQPPSEHINFVPVSSAFVRINVFKLVSMGTVDALTENDLNMNNIVHNEQCMQIVF